MVITTKMGQCFSPKTSLSQMYKTIQKTKLAFNVFFVKECSYLLAAADIAIVGHMISNGF